MITVKQPHGSKVCMAACLAMIAGVTLDEVLAEVRLREPPKHPGKGGYLDLAEAVRWLAEHGYIYGIVIGNLSGIGDNVEEIAVVHDLKVILRDNPALLGVKSTTFEGCMHSVVWDNEAGVVRDPNPKVPETTKLSEYEIDEWAPVVKLEPNWDRYL